jgi:hypothetical protein
MVALQVFGAGCCPSLSLSMGTNLSDVTKREAQQIPSGALWEVEAYLVLVTLVLELYQPSYLGSNFFVWDDI